ncbi:MAG: diadenylate cyclase CdaA [Oscillospiraceae bacterium]|nr:diadenylate cyclase CdaA [Oscillospiraceae bacterium]
MHMLQLSAAALLPSLHELWESVFSVIRTMKPVDFIDIAVLSYIIYYFFTLIRETRAGQLAKGIFFLVVAYVIAHIAGMKAIPFMLETLAQSSLLAILIVFQPEVRRAVEKLGHSRFGLNNLGLLGTNEAVETQWREAIDAVCSACMEMSATKTGALIVFERQTRLGEQISNGTILNATPSKELFSQIFYKNTPLHDGAVILRDGMVLAAACYLPTPERNQIINKKFGARHRAAIGMSENSDAIIVVVSEETGSISVAENGDLREDFTWKRLQDHLLNRLLEKQPKKHSLRSLLLRKDHGTSAAGSQPSASDTKGEEVRHEDGMDS